MSEYGGEEKGARDNEHIRVVSREGEAGRAVDGFRSMVTDENAVFREVDLL